MERLERPEGGRGLLVEGSMLGALYRVVRQLGAGASGIVYEVEHVRLRKRFAAKVLVPELAAEPEYVLRLEREAIAASSIAHPSVVEVVSLDQTPDGRVFLVEEFLDGPDLGTLLRDGGLEPATALAVARAVAQAMAAVHAAGIVHRDLKPANLILSRRPGGGARLKIVDFGVAKMDVADEARLTRTGSFLGTPMYMAPEQACEGGVVDARTDVYALGVILYEALTGVPPFVSTSALDLLLKHRSQPPHAPSAVAPELPARLDALVLTALAKDPDARWPSMDAFAFAIDETGLELGYDVTQIPDTGDAPPRNETTVQAARTFERPRRQRRLAVAAVAAVATIGVALSLVLLRSPPPAADLPRRVEPAAAIERDATPLGAAPAEAPPPVEASGARTSPRAPRKPLMPWIPEER